MDHFRMVLSNEIGAVEISRGTKSELLDLVNKRKDILLTFIRIATHSGRMVGIKRIGENKITWNL